MAPTQQSAIMGLLHHSNGSPNWIHIGLVCLLVFLGVRAVGLVFYRLFRHPLRKYPGPKIAAATQWYETYYSIFKGGQFPFQIQRLHKKYGPIVRVTPDEIHIDDPTFYETLFSPIDLVDKLPFLTAAGGLPGVVSFSTLGDFHRPRRMAVAPFFTRTKVLENFASEKGAIKSVAKRLSHRLKTEYAGTNKPVDIRRMLASAATDTIWEIVFCLQSHFIDAPDFDHPFPMSFEGVLGMAHWNSHFPWFTKVLNTVPEDWILWAMPILRANFGWRHAIRAQVEKIMETRALDPSPDRTLVHQLTQEKIPADVRAKERVLLENTNIVGASMGTTVWTMITDPNIAKRLQQELKEAIPDDNGDLPDVRELEKLPYLNACILEALRLGFGVMQRQTRIRPKKTVVYGEHVFGPGTPIAMDVWHMHTNETLFPDPMRFNPERWLGEPIIEEGADPLVPGGVRPKRTYPLSHYMRAFSGGTRGCFAEALGRAVITIEYATLFRWHEMHLHQSTSYDRDVKVTRDVFQARPQEDSKGVFVIVDK